MIQIQTTITGYGGNPCTLFSAYDNESRVLAISAEASYRTQRRDGCVVLANSSDIARDGMFNPEDMKPAIAAFYALKAGISADGKTSRLVFSERAARANPESSIERDGIDASGERYRIAEGITCGQIAALVTCLHAMRGDAIERSVVMAESFRRLGMGEILTL